MIVPIPSAAKSFCASEIGFVPVQIFAVRVPGPYAYTRYLSPISKLYNCSRPDLKAG